MPALVADNTGLASLRTAGNRGAIGMAVMRTPGACGAPLDVSADVLAAALLHVTPAQTATAPARLRNPLRRTRLRSICTQSRATPGLQRAGQPARTGGGLTVERRV